MSSTSQQASSTTTDFTKFLNENLEIQQLKALPGVSRVEVEFYSVFGSKTKNPIIVVVCNPDFRDRGKIPNYVNNIRVIVSYEEEVPKQEVDALMAEAENDDSSSSDDDDDMAGPGAAPAKTQ
eukprot:GEZU01002286.1.p1 GENE.GEZU01002286.1~~GEZU01002286.1.p1  ORF type:complete len:123 (+),score=24.75 GEZU01002286.1:143-511(+)